MKSKVPLKFAGLLSLAAVLNPLTGIFGAIPMRTLRRVYGRTPFWISFLSMSAAFFVAQMPVQGAFLLLLTLLIGVYAEVEAHGEGVFVSGLAAVLTSLGLTAVGATLWLMHTGSTLMAEMKVYVGQMATEAAAMNPDVKIDPDTLVRTMPSAIVITLIVAMGIALIWDRVIASLFRLPNPSAQVAESFRAFRAPDIFVWITTASIFAAYYKHGNVLAETIGLNVFYTMVALFFFQGVAVIGQGFRTFKVGPIWQTLWVVMMIIQFYAVAFLGFADFWIDFRSRFQRRSQKPDRVTENRL
jgi:hypothetical protein